MNLKRVVGWGLVVGVCLVSVPVAQAAFYDDFQDGHYWQDPNDEPWVYSAGPYPIGNNPPLDPNLWDVDNPHWTFSGVIGRNYAVATGDGWLRLYCELDFLENCFIHGTVDDGDRDPNTSVSYFSDAAPHYIVAKAKVYDPNMGEVLLYTHAHPVYWTGYGVDLECDDDRLTASWFEGTHWNGKGPSKPGLNKGTGFWMVCQFDGDGDPNNSYIRVAAWNGEKFDWDGNWHYEGHILTIWDPNSKGYWSEGMTGIATLMSPEAGGGIDTDAKFDQVECRWGTFSNVGRSLTFEIYKPENGTATIDPDLLVDPNNLSTDPNVLTDPNEPRIYTDGTEVVFVAHPDPNGPGFNMWEVFDPADSNNDFTDSNLVLTLTMDRDWKVTARYKCGSGGLLPMAGMTLLALGMGLVIRRIL